MHGDRTARLVTVVRGTLFFDHRRGSISLVNIKNARFIGTTIEAAHDSSVGWQAISSLVEGLLTSGVDMSPPNSELSASRTNLPVSS